MSEPTSDRVMRTILSGVVAAILVLAVFQMILLARVSDTVHTTEARLQKMEGRLDEIAARIDRIEERSDKFEGDQSLLVDDMTKMAKKVDHLVASMEGRGGGPGVDEAPEPPAVDWTQPQLFEAARKTGAEYGIELTADEIRIPSRFVLRQGAIEYFAVLRGGKEHETLISVIGNTPKGERRPKDFGARINNAIQALGFKRGKPVRYSATGREPPQGEPIYLFVEWEEKGEKVLARAEDLIWNRTQEKPMDRGKWVYIGSRMVQTDDPTMPVFAADITGEMGATYSSPDTIIDNTTAGDADDDTYLVASPRIPEDVDNCTLVIRRKDREATRIFPDPPKSSGTEQGGDGEKPR